MKRLLLSLIALAAVYFLPAQQTRTLEQYKEAVHNLALTEGVPLVSVGFRSGNDSVRFECAQVDEITPRDDASTVFLVASVTKPTFSYIVMRMYDKGEIDLDRPLYEYTDIDKFNNKEWAKKLTARMVMIHRTGLPNWSIHGSNSKWPQTKVDFKHEPGTMYTYSGEGFAFLQRAIESIRGKSLQEIAQEELFGPLGMTDSSFGHEEKYMKIMADGYKEGENQGKFTVPRQNSAYSLRTSVKDYTKFLNAVLTGWGLKPETFEMMMTSYCPGTNAEVNTQNIFRGLGFMIEENEHYGRIYCHSGSTWNFRTFFLVIPKTDGYLVFFTNSPNGTKLRPGMKEIFFGSEYPIKILSRR